ncbi:MAG TPA: class I SAM-dependent methyltransferase [Pirellulales bacterium]
MQTLDIVQQPWTAKFRALPLRTAWFSSMVMEHVPRDRPVRILDVGCGTGDLTASLAHSLPQATLTGLDISRANIETAARLTSDPTIAKRLEFVCADYLSFQPPEPFDLIISDGVLHLVHDPAEQLFAKLSTELARGGQLVFAIPYPCAFNFALVSVRRCLRAVRGPWTDRLIFAVARALHAHQMPDELLRERVHYMYLVPQRVLSAKLVERLEHGHDLQHVADRSCPHASFGQPKHRVAVFRKPGECRLQNAPRLAG